MKGELALKIDISKAYDKVDWGFMRGMLERLGFANKWIHWMMLCVSSVNYHVLVNFEKVGPIFPGRGLRQEDPLSPYLFILVTEGLTTLIKKSVANGDLHGVQICRGAPSVSHLLFADDCFLFCRSTLSETNHLMNILKTYEEASGQEINLTKSEVFFSRNLTMAAQEDLSRIMGVRHVIGTGKYLGLPSMIGRKKKEVFAFIKDRIWKRINSWRGKALSRAGKEIMIKSVLQAIPSYVMSVYVIPDSITKDIERMLNSFWWGGGAHNKGIRWLAWDRMTLPKAKGGLGFRDLHTFNLSMIAKQGWNIMTKPHTLVARLYKARYFANSTLFDSNIGHNPSYAWRGIWKARQILMNGYRWSIGNGNNIKVMSDPWLREKEGTWIPSPQVQGAYNITVNELMVENVKMWDKVKIESLFPQHIAKCILGIPLFDTFEEDKLIWVDSKYGQYSVKSGYNLLLNSTGKYNSSVLEGDWNTLWKIHAPPKVKHFLWRVCRCLPTRTRLQERRVHCPLSCPICSQHIEDDWHIFFSCNDNVQASQVAGLDNVIAPRLLHHNNVKDVIFEVCAGENQQIAGAVAVLLWSIWNNRNNCVWNEIKETGRSIGFTAWQVWHDWYTVHHIQQQAGSSQQQHQSLEWQKPDTDWYKCNVDAGFHNAINKTSIGWCLRDCRGSFVLAGTMWKDGICSIVEGESIAILEAMKVITQKGISNVIFETDSKSTVDAIHALRGGNSEFCSFICHIQNALSCNQNFLVKFIKRQANMVAHTLARAAIAWASRCIFETLPLCITHLLNNEMI
jgi:ribonuclease HI